MALNENHPDSLDPITVGGGETMVLARIDDFTRKAHFAGPNISFAEFLALWPNAGMGPPIIVPAHYLKEFHPDYSHYTDFPIFQQKEDWIPLKTYQPSVCFKYTFSSFLCQQLLGNLLNCF